MLKRSVIQVLAHIKFKTRRRGITTKLTKLPRSDGFRHFYMNSRKHEFFEKKAAQRQLISFIYNHI